MHVFATKLYYHFLDSQCHEVALNYMNLVQKQIGHKQCIFLEHICTNTYTVW